MNTLLPVEDQVRPKKRGRPRKSQQREKKTCGDEEGDLLGDSDKLYPAYFVPLRIVVRGATTMIEPNPTTDARGSILATNWAEEEILRARYSAKETREVNALMDDVLEVADGVDDLLG